MLESYSRAWTEIDYDAIAHNVEEVRKLVKKTKIMGIVKANAYGLGDVACAKALQKCGVDYFGVSSVDEALNLRNAGIQDNILILGYTPSMHFHYLHEQNIVQSLISIEYARELNAYAKENNVKIRCHCKVDTGMCRTGIVYQEQDKHIEDIYEEYHMENLCVEGIFSHFPVSDCLDENCRSFTTKQIQLFDEVVDLLKSQGIDPGIRHLQNSYGILNYPELEYEYCRPGLLYMGVTSDDQIPIQTNPDFIPIMSMYANVSLVKWIYPGQSVSYGRHFVAEKPTKVATMSIGYADGLPRLLSNQGFEVLVHGQRCKLIGNLCMDQCMIDVTDIPDVKLGDTVIVMGKEGKLSVTADDIGDQALTIPYEITCGFGQRLEKIVV